MIRALILDAGGVLVYPVRGNWTVPYALPFDPGPRWAEACANAAEYLREDVLLDMAGEFEKRLLFLRSMNNQLEWHFDEAQLHALADDFTHNPARYGWYDDVEPMLATLGDKYRLGMLTDAMPSFPAFVQARGLSPLFESIVASTQIGACKPDPRIYLEICQRMNIAPEECLFVDDRPGNLSGAQAVGMAVVQMCRDGLEPWDGPYVRNLTELNAYLEG